MNNNLRIAREAKWLAGLRKAAILLPAFLFLSTGIQAACVAGFTYSVSGGKVTFTNTTTGVSSVADYVWNFGDGASSATKHPVYTYTVSGGFLVSLTVRDSVMGCSDYYQDTVHITGVCKAAFTSYNQWDEGTFYASNAGTGATYSWTFGDGGSATSSSPYASHTYANAGTYNVCLVVSSSTCVDTLCDSITIAGPNPCKAAFTWQLGTKGKVTFTNTSMTLSGGSPWYYWDFGDGIKDTGKNPVHSYSVSGSYAVTLWISDSGSGRNCSAQFTDSIKVTGACNADFSFDNSNGPEVSFYSSYKGFSSYAWSFGDGANSSEDDIQHTYASAGNYTVCLKVYGDSGCVDSVCKSITVSAAAIRKIYGFVDLEDTTAAPDTGVAYLIYYDPTDSSLYAVDTVMFGLDSSSRTASFTFHNVKKGSYLVKAALIKASQFYKQYLPTYADTARKWKDAATIVVDYDQYVWITLQKGKNKGGKGFIGGKVSQGANKKEGDPLENIEVQLIDASTNEPAAYTYTDINGVFSFENLAYGTYEVYTEVTGLTTHSALVTISEAAPTVDDISVKVSSSGVTTSLAFKPGDIFAAAPKLYPNPARELIYLSMEVKTGTTGILSITDYSGRTMLTRTLSLNAGKQAIPIATEGWPAGLYLLRLEAAEGMVQYRFVKIN